MSSLQGKVFNLVLRLALRKRLDASSSIADMRKNTSATDKLIGRINSVNGLKISQTMVGQVACEHLELPDHAHAGTILYLHGGGFCLKSPSLHRAFLGRLCRQSGMSGVMVDYRLAPEHPFPAGLEDCLAAYQGLLEQGVEPQSIVIAGDSAGGNLTLATLLKIKSAGLPQPACAVLLSPGLDMTMSGFSYIEKYHKDPILTQRTVMQFRNAYLGERLPALISHPEVSPLLGDLRGLPPIICQTGEEELLRDDSTSLAQKAELAGVAFTSKIWPGMPHVFPVFDILPEAKAATREIAEFVQRHLAERPTGSEEPVGKDGETAAILP